MYGSKYLPFCLFNTLLSFSGYPDRVAAGCFCAVDSMCLRDRRFFVAKEVTMNSFMQVIFEELQTIQTALKSALLIYYAEVV